MKTFSQIGEALDELFRQVFTPPAAPKPVDPIDPDAETIEFIVSLFETEYDLFDMDVLQAGGFVRTTWRHSQLDARVVLGPLNRWRLEAYEYSYFVKAKQARRLMAVYDQQVTAPKEQKTRDDKLARLTELAEAILARKNQA